MSILEDIKTNSADFYDFFKNGGFCDLILTTDEKEAYRVSLVLELFCENIFILPELRFDYLSDLRSYSDDLLQLNETLNAYYECNKKKILISPFQSVTKYLPAKELFQSIKISFGDNLHLKDLKSQLSNWGYSFVDIVEQKGECSFRGDIIDIFSTKLDNPCRISLFDNQVESIKLFDESTQRTISQELEEILIYPALFALDDKNFEKIDNLVKASTSDAFYKDLGSLGFWYLKDLGIGKNFLELERVYKTDSFEDEIDEIYSYNENGFIPKNSFLNTKHIPKSKIYRELELKDPKRVLEFHKNKKIKLITSSEVKIKQHQIDLNEKIKVINSGAIINIVSDSEIILSLNKFEKQKKKKRSKIVLDELSVGDYVVHENYGVGSFVGLEQVSILGGIRDFVALKYLGEDKLLIPVENLHLIDRYVGDSGTLPMLDKLGKGSFQKLKDSVRKKLTEIAAEIIKRAAQRELISAKEIKIDKDDLFTFQECAGFEYTKDQTKSINEILEDLKSKRVMDRLLSGDVGFGKTEVAMNAIFATVYSGLQVAIVVPTTLLSNQHFHTLQKRFESLNISIAKFDRFTSSKDKTTYTKAIKDGVINIVVGTHAILGVEFKNLGLMIIDEEHKFGVKHKELLKDKSKDLHLLSMSATPIPRSLNMALSKIKGYSQILTPPNEREDVRTFVKEFDDKLVKEAVFRELRRGGQVFYVFNNIAAIENKKKELNKIMPDLKILVLHSKVSAVMSEKELIKFEDKEYDLLLSTTIIESGIHMPNVNTIIIDEANRFGIADLHQLRGRVGRAKKQGYCYYLVKDKDNLSDDSKKRLIALENNSFLGSGSILAYHDLEIRGGGNIVGADQSGHIKNIGYSLYLKMLEDEINKLSGVSTDEEQKYDVEIKLTVKAYISPELVYEDRLRIELYRRLSQAKEIAQIYEILEEIEDRFSKADDVTKAFIEIMSIKYYAQKLNIKNISNFKQNITITYQNDKKESLVSPSKDDDDLINTTIKHIRNLYQKFEKNIPN